MIVRVEAYTHFLLECIDFFYLNTIDTLYLVYSKFSVNIKIFKSVNYGGKKIAFKSEFLHFFSNKISMYG